MMKSHIIKTIYSKILDERGNAGTIYFMENSQRHSTADIQKAVDEINGTQNGLVRLTYKTHLFSHVIAYETDIQKLLKAQQSMVHEINRINDIMFDNAIVSVTKTGNKTTFQTTDDHYITIIVE